MRSSTRATPAREGELIFAYLYEKAKAKKARETTVAELDDDRSDEGRAPRRCAPAEEFALLEQAARSRSEADWIVGMNATRAATIRLAQLVRRRRVARAGADPRRWRSIARREEEIRGL